LSASGASAGESAAAPRAILVTGGAKRVGRAVSEALAARGRAVAIHAGSDLDAARALAEAINAGGGRAVAVRADLREPKETAGLIARAADALGEAIDGLVNNASTFEGDAAQDFTEASWDLHFEVNLRAPCMLARDMAAALPADRRGGVVNLLDQRVFKRTPLFFTYSLSKAALLEATRTLAQALAPRVRVNAVAPGPTLRNVRQSPEDFARQVDATLLGTGSPVLAVAEAVCWMLDATHATGQTIAVDGGQSLVWQTPDVVGIVE
jgi:NAD(P)-dependent dehydrogenase (short-subunit alcohol dehydrogenase family)